MRPWQIKGVHGTIYLFGSVHVMRKEVHWETPKVKDAYKLSSVRFLEISNTDEESVKAMQPMIMQLGLDMQHPLSTKIPKEDVDALDAAIKKMGGPGERVEALGELARGVRLLQGVRRATAVAG